MKPLNSEPTYRSQARKLLSDNLINEPYTHSHKTYAEAISQSQPHSQTSTQPKLTMENFLIKQSEKIDMLLQQISTLVGLITSLVTSLEPTWEHKRSCTQ